MSLNLRVNYDADKQQINVNVGGELDIYTSNEFKEAVIKEFSKNREDIVINAKELKFVDSTGLGVLISILKESQENEKKIYIDHAKANIRKIFDITDLDKLFIFRGEQDE